MFTLTSKVKGYLIKGALVAVCAAAVWMNIQILSAKNERIKTHEATIVKLTKDNEDLKKEMLNKGKSEAITELAKEDLKKTETKHEKAKSQANQYVEKKLADIEKKYAAMEQSATNLERKRTEISLERAKGLWLSFCLQAPQEQACK